MSNDLEHMKEVGQVFEALEGVEKPPQKVIDEVTKRLGLSSVSEGDYQDYAFQVACDRKFVAFIEEMWSVLGKMRYIPLFLSEEEKKKMLEANSQVAYQIVGLIEKHEIPYIMLNNIAKEIGGNLQNTLQRAVNVANNKAAETLTDIAKQYFETDELCANHVRDYLERKGSKAAST